MQQQLHASLRNLNLLLYNRNSSILPNLLVKIFDKIPSLLQISGAQLERGRPALPFFENRKKCPDFRKKALIVSILALNLLFKM